MNLEDFKITSGINSHQNASIERNEKTIDYSSSKPLSYADNFEYNNRVERNK